MAATGLVRGITLPNAEERRSRTRKGGCGSSSLRQKMCFKQIQNIQTRLAVDREIGIRCREREIEAKEQQRSGFVCPDPSFCKMPGKKKLEEPFSLEKLEQWIRDSVTEIVSNTVDAAPFLLYVYSSKGGCSTRFEKVDAVESWARIRNRWVNGSCCCPDGLILVEQLRDQDEDEEERFLGGEDNQDGNHSRSWGLVIQGKGIDGSACYILKTSRVYAPAGICTHFCLIRAKCFGDSAEKQLRDSWLQIQ